MGASPTKVVMNSLPNNFAGFTRRDSKRGISEGSGMLVPVRSNSLDSISTVLSSGTNHQSLSRASSLDSLPIRGRQTHLNGRLYTLLDNVSVASSIDPQEGKSLMSRKNPSTEPKQELSRTWSDPFGSRVRESDEFSDNFVEASEVPLGSDVEHAKNPSTVTMESRPPSLPAKSILKESKSLPPLEPSVPDNHESPQLAADIRAKLTSEEWAQVISYTCANLEKCLQQDLIKPCNEGGSLTEQRETTSDTPANKRVTISDEVSTSMYERGSVVADGVGTTTVQTLYSQERPRQHRRHRERPRSLPPVYWREDSEQWGVEEQYRGYTRARANSQEESYYYRCTTDQSKPRTRKHDSSRSRRSKKRSQRNTNAPVDTSLDDNCPGVEKYRRPQHRHVHHHTLVSQYLERGERRAIKDKSSDVSTDHKDDKSMTISLRDIKDSTMVLKHTAEVAGTKVVSLSNSYTGQGQHKRHSFKRTKHASIEDQAEVEVVDSSLTELVGEEEEVWNELMFPNDRSHSSSGRDSPATDMAVMDLNLDHPVMMLPTRSRLNNRSAVIAGNFVPPAHKHSHSKRYLVHSHSHYHHIIHHGQS